MKTEQVKINTKPIGYGVVGLGRAGWNNHIGQLRHDQNAKVVAVADPQPSRGQQAEQELGCRSYADLDAMLDDPDVEVVLIATPSVQHAKDTIKALESGRHVIVEKPIAMNLAEADRMIAVARAADRHLFVHHQHRFRAPFAVMSREIQSGRLGRIYHIRNYISRFHRRYDWQTLTALGGGELNNTCPHFLDQMLQLLGSPVKEVMADLQRIAWVGDAEDHVKVLLRTRNGATGDMEITNGQNLSHPLPLWMLCGTHGTVTVTNEQAVIRWFDPKQVQPIEPEAEPPPQRNYSAGDLPWQEETVSLDTVETDSFYDNVFDVLRTGGQMCVTPESGRELIRVMEMIQDAAKPHEGIKQDAAVMSGHVPVQSAVTLKD